jgi:hypothetical protein
VPTTSTFAPVTVRPLRCTPRTKPSPSNMSPSSVPSGRSSTALHAPATRTVGVTSSSSATTLTLCGIVISAPWTLLNFMIAGNDVAKSSALTPIGMTTASMPSFSKYGL